MEIRFELFNEQDIPQLVSWVKDSEFLYQFAGPAYTFDNLAVELKNDIDKMYELQNTMMFKVMDAMTNEPIGHLQLLGLDMENKSGHVGRVLIGDESARGKGIGTKIIKGIVHHCFDELELEKITLNVFEFNVGAIKCYEKIGFETAETSMVTNPLSKEEIKCHRMILNRD